MAPEGPQAAPPDVSIIREMLLWEKAVWVLLLIYFIIVFVVFWLIGWSQLPFPV